MNTAKQSLCPRCNRRLEFLVETYITDGAKRVTYLYRCTCGWRKELETLLIRRENGKILITKEGRSNR